MMPTALLARTACDNCISRAFYERAIVGVWIIEAPPGCGKSTLMILHAQHHPARTMLVLTFMVATRDMLRARVRAAGLGDRVTCASIDALVNRVIHRANARDEDTRADLAEEDPYLDPDDDDFIDCADELREAAEDMRLRPRNDTNEFTVFERRIVHVLQTPALCDTWAATVLATYDVVFCDEAQDLSPYHAALMHVAERRLRTGAVCDRAIVYAGDSDQHIFGFRNSQNLLRSGGAAPAPTTDCAPSARTYHVRLAVSYRLHERSVRLVRHLCSKPIFGAATTPFRAFRRDTCDLENAFIFVDNGTLLAFALAYTRPLRILGWPLDDEPWGEAHERFTDRVATRSARQKLIKHVTSAPPGTVDVGAVRVAVDAMNMVGDDRARDVLRSRMRARMRGDSARAPEPPVVFATVWGYKGQETDVVRLHPDVLALHRRARRGDASSDQWRYLLVVALTRARLAIVAAGDSGTELEASDRLHDLPPAIRQCVLAFCRE